MREAPALRDRTESRGEEIANSVSPGPAALQGEVRRGGAGLPGVRAREGLSLQAAEMASLTSSGMSAFAWTAWTSSSFSSARSAPRRQRRSGGCAPPRSS